MTDYTTDTLQFIHGRIAAYKVVMAQCENEIRQLEGTLKKHEINRKKTPKFSFREYFEKRNGRKYAPIFGEMMDGYIPLLLETIADYMDEVVK